MVWDLTAQTLAIGIQSYNDIKIWRRITSNLRTLYSDALQPQMKVEWKISPMQELKKIFLKTCFSGKETTGNVLQPNKGANQAWGPKEGLECSTPERGQRNDTKAKGWCWRGQGAHGVTAPRATQLRLAWGETSHHCAQRCDTSS